MSGPVRFGILSFAHHTHAAADQHLQRVQLDLPRERREWMYIRRFRQLLQDGRRQ